MRAIAAAVVAIMSLALGSLNRVLAGGPSAGTKKLDLRTSVSDQIVLGKDSHSPASVASRAARQVGEGDLAGAERLYLEAIKLTEASHGTADVLATLYCNVATVLSQEKKIDEAARYFELAVDLCRSRHLKIPISDYLAKQYASFLRKRGQNLQADFVVANSKTSFAVMPPNLAAIAQADRNGLAAQSQTTPPSSGRLSPRSDPLNLFGPDAPTLLPEGAEAITANPNNPTSPVTPRRYSHGPALVNSAAPYMYYYSSGPSKREKNPWEVRWPKALMPLHVYIPQRSTDSTSFTAGSSAISDGSASTFVMQAFDAWAQASNGAFQVTYVDVPNQADIRCQWTDNEAFMHSPLAVGETSLIGGASGRPAGHAIGLLSVDRFTGKQISRDRFYEVSLHEIGHALGLGHSQNPDDVMFPAQRPMPVSELSQGDRDSIQRLYSQQ